MPPLSFFDLRIVFDGSYSDLILASDKGSGGAYGSGFDHYTGKLDALMLSANANTSSDICQRIGFTMRNGASMGYFESFQAGNRLVGESGYCQIYSDGDLLINTYAGKNTKIGTNGGYQGQIEVETQNWGQSDPEWDTDKNTSIRLGKGFMTSSSRSFLSMKRTRMDGGTFAPDVLTMGFPGDENAIVRRSYAAASDVRLKERNISTPFCFPLDDPKKI